MKEIIKEYVPASINVKIIFHLARDEVLGTILNGTKRLNKDSFIKGLNLRAETCFVEVVN
jgi:hypothetical protein